MTTNKKQTQFACTKNDIGFRFSPRFSGNSHRIEAAEALHKKYNTIDSQRVVSASALAPIKTSTKYSKYRLDFDKLDFCFASDATVPDDFGSHVNYFAFDSAFFDFVSEADALVEGRRDASARALLFSGPEATAS